MIIKQFDEVDKTERKINTASCAPFLKFFNKTENDNLKLKEKKKQVTIGEVYVRLLEKCKNKHKLNERRETEDICTKNEDKIFRRSYNVNNNNIYNEKTHDPVGEMYLRTLKSFKSNDSLYEKRKTNNFSEQRKSKPEVIYPKNRAEYLKKLNNVDNVIDFRNERENKENKRDVAGEMYIETLKKFKTKSYPDLSKKNTVLIVDEHRHKSEMIDRTSTKDNFFHLLNVNRLNSKINQEENRRDTVGLMYLNTLKNFRCKTFIKLDEANDKLKDLNVIKKAFDQNKQTNNTENNNKRYSVEELYLKTLKSLRKTKNLNQNAEQINENNFCENRQKNKLEETSYFKNNPLSFYSSSLEKLNTSEEKLMNTGSEILKLFNLSPLIIEAIDKIHLTSKDVACYE